MNITNKSIKKERKLSQNTNTKFTTFEAILKIDFIIWQ